MKEWQIILNNSPIEWLLEKDNPSVQFYTLTELLDKKIDLKQ